MKLLLLFFLLSLKTFATIPLPQSFHANFTQKITNSKKKVLEYRGSLSFSDKKYFKWSYLEPSQKEVCTDGFELLVVDHDLEQVSHYYISKGLDIAKVLKTAKYHKKNIYLAKYNDIEYTIQVDKKQRLHSIAYFDVLDNKVQVIFKNIKYAEKVLSEKNMECVYPSTYDMIKG
jgi:outer membrane lipoprotein carrier protein